MRQVSRTILKPISDDAKADAKGGPETDSVSSQQRDAKAAAMAAVRKPAWAMSEKQVEELTEAKELAEEDELLDFAKSLDYDKFITDLEVKVMVEKLRDRIQELEKDVENEKEREVDAETRAARREMLELMGQAQSRLSHAQEFSLAGGRSQEDQEAIQKAKVLLEDVMDEREREVHSTKSVVQLLKNAKEKISNVAMSVKTSTGAEPKVMNEVS
jgi:hypothetical protein